ncbi:hypothetical protein AAFX91_00360 [Bradyrhizobium sp. 31Argb]|uniref:hypothetical protein n=1 Tax=unclassified Bradyrhizobium TaxID=2631580 RepID=UPI00102E4410|nr:hypothetical protein [Bradyrhizobium sp. Leo170]TAI66769.1 hypothetical protein CWO89_06460 [Bradyrhizobium sp. Leo170]
MKKTGLLVMALALAALEAASAAAQQSAPSLRFGMKPDEVAGTLGVPLTYVRGRRGSELYLALPNVKGSAFASRSDGLYLQFRNGKLAGWKGDWGTIRP